MTPGQHAAASDRPRAAFATGMGVCLRFVLALWLLDALWLLREPVVHRVATLRGLLAGLFLALCAAAVLGAAVGGVLWLARTPAAAGAAVPPSRAARLRRWLCPEEPQQRLLRSGTLLSLPLLLLGFAAGSFLLTQRLIIGMARPEFAALAILATHLLLLAGTWLVAPALRSLGSWLALGLGRMPWLGPRVFREPRHFAGWLLGAGALALGLFVFVYRAPLAFLPLRELGQAALALALAGMLTWWRSRPRVLALALRSASIALLCAASFVGLSLRSEELFARRIAEQRLLSGGLGHGALMLALDADGDGHLPMLGGGDCAPLDPARHPAALDVPGNGIDEDCDGADLDPRSLPPMGVYDAKVSAAVPKRPPIVLITIDAFAARHMQALGGKRPVTPNLDALAKKSAFFRSCFTQGPSTRLSFPALFTSRWDSQIKQRLVGKHPYPIDASEVMLAEVLRNAGYDTAAILPDPYFARSRWGGITSGFARVIETPFTERPALPHNGARVTAAAIAELARPRTDPLFMWVHYYDAHSPHSQPPGAPVYGKTRSDLYDAELSYVDAQLQTLLAEIERALGGQALVIITGDHGIAFDAPRHAKFNYGYDLATAVLHVPLIVHAPFIPPRSMDGVVSTMDIAPTLVNLLRLRGAFPFQGVSLVPELLEGKRARPPLLMHQMFLEERLWKNEEPLERVSLRTDRYNLVHERKAGYFELYDYRNDYFEKQDLSNHPAHEAAFRELKQDLLLLSYLTRFQEPAAKPPRPRSQASKPPKRKVAASPPAASPAEKAQARGHDESHGESHDQPRAGQHEEQP